MSRPVCIECLCLIDETGCGCVQPIEPFTNHEQGEKMNANELMPQLEELKAEVLKLIEKNNNQQAEIDFLKKEILEKHEDWKHEGQQAANARAEIEVLKKVLQEVVRISDRNHDAWNKAKELLK